MRTDDDGLQAMDRRRFLGRAVGSLGTAGLLTTMGWPVRLLGQRAEPGPWFQVSLAQWSLHRTIRKGDLEHLDFASFTRETFDISAVEYVNQFFKDRATDTRYIAEMKTRADDHGVTSLLIMIDGEGALGDPDPSRRAQAIEKHKPWLAAACALGCHSIRVNARSAGSYEEQRGRAADGLRRLSDHAAPLGLNVIVENHGGLSSNGAWLSAVIREVGLRNCGTLPDFGNFNLGDGKEYDRYRGVRELMPHAKAVSAKTHDFDGDGNETRTDFGRMMTIVKDAGYRGHVGIEYEGGALSEVDGIRATMKLLERERVRR